MIILSSFTQPHVFKPVWVFLISKTWRYFDKCLRLSQVNVVWFPTLFYYVQQKKDIDAALLKLQRKCVFTLVQHEIWCWWTGRCCHVDLDRIPARAPQTVRVQKQQKSVVTITVISVPVRGALGPQTIILSAWLKAHVVTIVYRALDGSDILFTMSLFTLIPFTKFTTVSGSVAVGRTNGSSQKCMNVFKKTATFNFGWCNRSTKLQLHTTDVYFVSWVNWFTFCQIGLFTLSRKWFHKIFWSISINQPGPTWHYCWFMLFFCSGSTCVRWQNDHCQVNDPFQWYWSSGLPWG